MTDLAGYKVYYGKVYYGRSPDALNRDVDVRVAGVSSVEIRDLDHLVLCDRLVQHFRCRKFDVGHRIDDHLIQPGSPVRVRDAAVRCHIGTILSNSGRRSRYCEQRPSLEFPAR